MTSVDEFITAIVSKAQEEYTAHHLFASTTIAQAIHETGEGKYIPGKGRSNNIFGIKWTPKCGFPYVQATTREFINGEWIVVPGAKFRKYASFDECIEDRSKILSYPRYGKVPLSANRYEQCIQLQKCGWATGPEYGFSLIRDLEAYKLWMFDPPIVAPPSYEGMITPHFSWQEAKCKDGAPVPEEYKDNAIKLAQRAENLRSLFDNKPMHVLSWYRTPKYNSGIKGAAKNSEHLRANAMDFYIAGISNQLIYKAADALGFGGVGLYRWGVHIDNRDLLGKPKARWKG